MSLVHDDKNAVTTEVESSKNQHNDRLDPSANDDSPGVHQLSSSLPSSSQNVSQVSATLPIAEPTSTFTPFPVAIPTSSSGLSTFAYQRALAHRIQDKQLERQAKYDLHRYTPTFIHDTLMLPGSLASLLNKSSALAIIPRLTPAILPRFCVCVDEETHTPRLRPASAIGSSSGLTEYVHGLLLLGEGKTGRQLVDQHFRDTYGAHRVKLEVQLDVFATEAGDTEHVTNAGDSEHDFEPRVRQLRRTAVMAHVWISRPDCCLLGPQMWTLEGYLEGTLGSPDGDGLAVADTAGRREQTESESPDAFQALPWSAV